MSFTKVTSAGIGSTELVTLDSLEVINNASIGGVLTYEDVTNVDSIGIITARAGVLVGSGITLSKDGDIFATGVCTATSFVGSGANLTGVASTENIRTNTNATFLQNINVSGSTTTGSLVSSGAVSGTTGTFSAAVSGTTGTFSGAVSGTTGTFTGDVDIADKIVHTGDTNTAIRFPASDKITLETSGTERFQVDSSGAIYVGGSGASATAGKLWFNDTSAYSSYIKQVAGSSALTFHTGQSQPERLRIASDGKSYFVGSTSGGFNATSLPNGNTININTKVSNDGVSVIRYSGSYAAYALNIGRSKSDTIGTNSIVADGDDLGHITWYGADGSDFNQAVAITAQVDGTPSDGTDMPGRLIFKTSADGSGTPTEKLRIDSTGRMTQNGTTSADTASALTLKNGVSGNDHTILELISDPNQYSMIYLGASDDRYRGQIRYKDNDHFMSFHTSNAERLRIDSSGTLHLGATSYGGGGAAPLFYVSGTSGRQVKIHNTNSATTSLQLTNAATGQGEDQGFMLAALSSGAAYINNAESAQIYFATNNTIRATMSGTAEEMVMGAQDGFSDYSLGNGIFLAYATSSYSSTNHVIKGIHANTSFSESGGGMFFLGARRQSTSAYTLAGWYSGDGSSAVASDRQFNFKGDGNAHADGSWHGGGADYAEFFEWLDGNTSDENRKGISVVLDNGKIRAATGSDNTDNIIGVISAAPVVVGDSASERWKEKWITDDFGGVIEETYTITEWYDETEKKKVNYSTDRIPSDVTVGAGSSVLSTDENGNAFTRKKLNPSWDSTATYIPREDRKEWDIVGLMGKLKVKSDQPIGTKWIKMREVSASVHEYLVR